MGVADVLEPSVTIGDLKISVRIGIGDYLTKVYVSAQLSPECDTWLSTRLAKALQSPRMRRIQVGINLNGVSPTTLLSS